MPIEAPTLVRFTARTQRNLAAATPVLVLLCGVRGGVGALPRAGAADTDKWSKLHTISTILTFTF